jgi:hypothetical protein
VILLTLDNSEIPTMLNLDHFSGKWRKKRFELKGVGMTIKIF